MLGLGTKDANEFTFTTLSIISISSLHKIETYSRAMYVTGNKYALPFLQLFVWKVM